MRKLILGLLGLLLLLSTPAHATVLSLPDYISGQDVTISNLSTTNTNLENWGNGSIEGGGVNIKVGSIVSVDLANSVNIVTFRNEAFNDFTFTGMLPVTDSDLTSDISAGISYVNGVRIENNATAHTYTASKDTYVYIGANGSYSFEEVANGASTPTTPANTLLLAKVVTSGTAITSVSDLRTTSIQITSNSSNFAADYRNGAIISRDSTTTVHAEPGQIAIGGSFYTTTVDSSSKSTATGTNWIEGNSPTLPNLKFYVYAYNNSGTTFDIKYASADPVASDTDLNTGGTLRYYSTGGVTYRALAWISADSSGLIQDYNMGQFADKGILNRVQRVYTGVQTGAVVMPADDTIPQIGEGNEFMNIPFRATNANNKIRIQAIANAAGSNGSVAIAGGTALFQDTKADAIAVVTNPYKANNIIGTSALDYTMIAGDTNMHVFRIRVGEDAASTVTFNGSNAGRIFGGSMASMISVTEVES